MHHESVPISNPPARATKPAGITGCKMIEFKRSRPSQNESIRRAVLVGQSLVVSSFLFVALAAYLAFTTGAWQSFSFILLGVVLEVLIFIGIASARRGQLKTAGWLLLGMNLIGGIARAVFYVGLGYLGPFYILISSFFVIIYVLPREERRLAFVLIGISVVICVSLEVINPAWRQLSQLVQTLAPTFTVLMGIAFTAIIARQALSGNIRTKLIVSFTLFAVISLASVAFFDNRSPEQQSDFGDHRQSGLPCRLPGVPNRSGNQHRI